ncbi:hypothetical protein DJ010_03665 [Nocardioides silvaticus]|uniref:Uncharacterized protein n=1 Tax=Nocardioides silvaticus TaxID=2201891 RepID=A0A316TNW8_9ACTN|nr:hypothetical protein DJ010_03665 [Nocardioides silvaticus]
MRDDDPVAALTVRTDSADLPPALSRLAQDLHPRASRRATGEDDPALGDARRVERDAGTTGVGGGNVDGHRSSGEQAGEQDEQSAEAHEKTLQDPRAGHPPRAGSRMIER